MGFRLISVAQLSSGHLSHVEEAVRRTVVACGDFGDVKVLCSDHELGINDNTGYVEAVVGREQYAFLNVIRSDQNSTGLVT